MVATFADGDHPVGIVRIVAWATHCQGRPMIEENLAEDHPRSTIKTTATLPQHDMGAQALGGPSLGPDL